MKYKVEVKPLLLCVSSFGNFYPSKELASWLKEHVGGKAKWRVRFYSDNRTYIVFNDVSSAILFKMVWSGKTNMLNMV